MTTNTARGSRVVDLSWMSRGMCTGWADLPWTADPEHTTARALQVMAAVCHRCPVRSDCTHYAKEQRVTAGFWAGRHRDPHAPTMSGPGWATEPLPGLGGLGGAA